MDIAALSVVRSQAQLQQSVEISVMKKAMESMGEKSNLVNEMLGKIAEGRSAQPLLPHLGQNIDIYV
ncbi:MAG: putative motility protein [Peptococcaceae bacterium]|nr:putative motility protein [Peptococcaceae bacterium]